MPGTVPDDGWTEVSPARTYGRSDEVELGTDGSQYRFYLLWITALPEDSERVELSELRLFRAQNR